MANRLLNVFEDIGTPENTSGQPDLGVGWQKGILAPNGKVYCIPERADHILVINPDDSFYRFGTIPNALVVEDISLARPYWRGATLLGDKIYCAPAAAEAIGVIDTTNDTISEIGSFPDSLSSVTYHKFNGIWAVNGTLFMSAMWWTPFSAFQVGVAVVDPTDGSYDYYVNPSSGEIYTGIPGDYRIDSNGVVGPDNNIYSFAGQGWTPPSFGYGFLPLSQSFTRFNTSTMEIELVENIPSPSIVVGAPDPFIFPSQEGVIDTEGKVWFSDSAFLYDGDMSLGDRDGGAILDLPNYDGGVSNSIASFNAACLYDGLIYRIQNDQMLAELDNGWLKIDDPLTLDQVESSRHPEVRLQVSDLVLLPNKKKIYCIPYFDGPIYKLTSGAKTGWKIGVI